MHHLQVTNMLAENLHVTHNNLWFKIGILFWSFHNKCHQSLIFHAFLVINTKSDQKILYGRNYNRILEICLREMFPFKSFVRTKIASKNTYWNLRTRAMCRAWAREPNAFKSSEWLNVTIKVYWYRIYFITLRHLNWLRFLWKLQLNAHFLVKSPVFWVIFFNRVCKFELNAPQKVI